MPKMIKKLNGGYELRTLETQEFGPLWEKHAKEFFEDAQQIFHFRDALSQAELDKMKRLGERMGDPYRINLGIYHEGQFVGWSWGIQKSKETFYMCNSAVLPEHRRKGLYTAAMMAIVEEVTAKGFQQIYSRHAATNNAVIIPKLKAGFVISSFEVSDTFGVLIHLTYYSNPVRRKMLDYRVGLIRPDDEIRNHLKI